MTYSYNHLGPGDAAHLRQLLLVFEGAFGEPETYRSAPPSDEYLKKLLAKTDFIALAALADGAVVGGIIAYELQKPEQERSEIYLYDLAVAELHRRKGIATALITRLKGIAKERGAYVIFVQADREDIPAIKLYESLGIKEEPYHFDIPID